MRFLKNIGLAVAAIALTLCFTAPAVHAVTLDASSSPGARSQGVSKNAGGLFKGVSTSCWDDGGCTLCDGMVVLINVANAILRLLAIVAVLFFVYGAGLLVISQGNEDLISKGKSTLKATIFGTVIVLLGWQVMSLVVYFVVARSLGPDKTQKVTASSALDWYNVANSCQQQ